MFFNMKIQKVIYWVLGIGIIVGVLLIVFGGIHKKTAEAPIVIETTTPTEVPVDTGGTTTPTLTDFGKTVTFKINDKLTFADGLEVTLKEINDSRCPKGVQCIWAGEIAGLFAVSGGGLTAPDEVRVGTVNNTNTVSGIYTFTAKDATTDSISIEVAKK